MQLINVLKAFTVRLVHEGESIERRIVAGVQEVEDYIADHWYTKAHTGPLPAGVAAAPEKADSPQADASKDVATDAAPAKTAAKAGNK
ncbi:STY1053 family phage-associated protein [Burkholderia multivorans]|uniref:STY1053 family phage-associated protein n=1 Tax=Burkholderia multivorans TaxID=87883 RepID=UPI000F77DF27|nr:hypothetical protein [Burkholderia multivorans]MCA8249255.1 hypothetical protein [Burkholderia multivorans]MDR8920546.1 hypothetical protein [Burkholderia multivorans]MDR8921951.1 hypothetical protein [Burkholderia multivorans]MDR8967814.1 hypothetical protein [Burkholderia multivorans]MDR8993487.1 hypothetical protein [Burkholderia multivorans]